MPPEEPSVTTEAEAQRGFAIYEEAARANEALLDAPEDQAEEPVPEPEVPAPRGETAEAAANGKRTVETVTAEMDALRREIRDIAKNGTKEQYDEAFRRLQVLNAERELLQDASDGSLSGKKVAELRDLARTLGLSPAGDKAHLLARIRETRAVPGGGNGEVRLDAPEEETGEGAEREEWINGQKGVLTQRGREVLAYLRGIVGKTFERRDELGGRMTETVLRITPKGNVRLLQNYWDKDGNHTVRDREYTQFATQVDYRGSKGTGWREQAGNAAAEETSGAPILNGDDVRRDNLPGYDPADWRTHIDRTGTVARKMEERFQELLRTRKGKGNGQVVFLAGGNGAGKSTFAANLGGTPDFAIDSTLGNLDVARKQIEATLANGQRPVIVFVYRTPEQALEGIKGRMENGGHSVSPLSFADSHTKSLRNLGLLAREYGERIEVRIYDNSIENAPRITLEQLEAKGIPNHEELRKRANEELGNPGNRLAGRSGTESIQEGGGGSEGAQGEGGRGSGQEAVAPPTSPAPVAGKAGNAANGKRTVETVTAEMDALRQEIRDIAKNGTKGQYDEAFKRLQVLNAERELLQDASDGSLSGKKVAELRDLARTLGLSPAGDKAHLLARIRGARAAAAQEERTTASPQQDSDTASRGSARASADFAREEREAAVKAGMENVLKSRNARVEIPDRNGASPSIVYHPADGSGAFRVNSKSFSHGIRGASASDNLLVGAHLGEVLDASLPIPVRTQDARFRMASIAIDGERAHVLFTISGKKGVLAAVDVLKGWNAKRETASTSIADSKAGILDRAFAVSETTLADLKGVWQGQFRPGLERHNAEKGRKVVWSGDWVDNETPSRAKDVAAQKAAPETGRWSKAKVPQLRAELKRRGLKVPASPQKMREALAADDARRAAKPAVAADGTRMDRAKAAADKHVVTYGQGLKATLAQMIEKGVARLYPDKGIFTFDKGTPHVVTFGFEQFTPTKEELPYLIQAQKAYDADHPEDVPASQRGKQAAEGPVAGESAPQSVKERPETPEGLPGNAGSAQKTDKQGNPINDDGTLKLDKVESVADLTDEDFTAPKRNVQLPRIPPTVDAAIGADGKPVIIKRRIFLKNRDAHHDLSAKDGRDILNRSLYNPNLVGQTQPIRRPTYWVVIQTGDNNAVTVLEVSRTKDNVEIVGWRKIDAAGLANMRNQARREDGQLLILSPSGEGPAADLSTLPPGFVQNVPRDAEQSSGTAEEQREEEWTAPRSGRREAETGDFSGRLLDAIGTDARDGLISIQPDARFGDGAYVVNYAPGSHAEVERAAEGIRKAFPGMNVLSDGRRIVVSLKRKSAQPAQATKADTPAPQKAAAEQKGASLPRGAEPGNVGTNQRGDENHANHIRGRRDEASGGPGGEETWAGGGGNLADDEGGHPAGGPGPDEGRGTPGRGGRPEDVRGSGNGVGENADGTGNGPDGGGAAGAQVDERVAGGAGGKRAGRGGRGGGRNDGRGSVREPGLGGDVGVGDGVAVRGSRSGRPVQGAGEAGGGAGGAGGVPKASGGRRGNSENHVIDDPDFLDAGGAKAKFRDNLAALRVLKTLREEGREATPEERAVIAKYVGWGRSEFRNGLFAIWNDEWEKEREQLKEVLGADEYESARQSTLTAFWTPPRMAQAVWRALDRLGFKGGRIHEPAIGTGIFFGTMPEGIRDRSQLSGADKDVLASEIARQLYPGARISTGAFQEENLPDGFYDLVVGNFPFADITIRRDKYNRVSANLHDYFWLKSLGIVRPGGLVAAITSTGTMDKANDAVRREIAGKADVVAAIRLPEGTFSGVAGTEVVTDLVILRKREAGEEMSEDTKAFLETDWYNNLPGEHGYLHGHVNRYYELHPDHIIGKPTGTHGQYGQTTTIRLGAGENLQKRLDGILAGLPENLYAPRARKAEAPKTASAAELGIDASSLRDGSLVAKDGEIWENTPQGLVQVKGTPPQKRKARFLIELRDTLNALRSAETTDGSDEQLAALRKELNRRYDAFVKEYGPLNKKGMLGLMANDPSSHMLLALERSYNPDTGKAVKADIFSTRVGYAKSRATHADNYEQAAGFSMNETGHLDAARVGEMMGVDTETAERELLKQGLAFRAPDGTLVGADEYLSGNVRDKLRQAEAAAEVDPAFRANAEALRKVLPADKGPGDITANLGATWIPPDIMEAFSKHVLGLPEMEKGIVFEYSHALGRWTAFLPKDRYASSRIEHSAAFTNTYATRHRSFLDILGAAMDDQSIRITHKDPYTGKSEFDAVESAEANDKAEKLKDEFLAWIWKDKERAARLVRLYNDTFNGFVERKKGGRWLSFPGIAPSIKPRPHQVAAVEKLLACRRLLMAHEVGTGKTITYGLMAQKAKETGIASKPLLVVKNSTVQQVATEIQRLFPSMNIFVGGESMTAARRKRSMAQIANNNWDLVILTHDNLGSLDTDPAIERKFIDGQIMELKAAADAAVNSGMSKKDIDRIRRNLLKRIATLEERLKGLLESRKTDGVSTFQDLGFDMVMVDECQAFKKLPIATYRTRVKGIPVEGSKRASALLMNVQNLVDNNPEACVVFGSGTPLDNSLVEAYVWQRYLQNDLLRNAGITSFDAWASNFGRTTSDLEMSPSGGDWKEVERFKEFVNLGELSSMMRQNMDVVFAKDTGEIVRPERHDTDDLTAQSEISKAVIDELEARAKALKTKGGKPGKGDDNMLVICGDGRKAAVHPGLYKAEYTGVKGTKADACIRRVAANHKADPKAAQMIFCDCGVNDTEWDFNLYRYLREGLVKAGFAPGQVAFFSSNLSAKARSDLAEKMNAGEVLVAIGSTDTMGTGVNAQKRLRWMHHLDASRMMTPGSIEQRNGRGHRQGNEYKDVESVYYIQERSLDTFTWNLIKNKAGFINAFLRGENLGTIEEESDTIPADQLVAIASGDPRVFRKAKVEKQLHRLRLQEEAFKQSQADLEQDRNAEEWKVRNAEKEIGALEGAVELAAATTGRPFSAEVVKSGVLPASTHAERNEALGAALDAAVDATATRLDGAGTGKRETVAKYRGFEIQVGWETDTKNEKRLRYYLRLPGGSGVSYYLSPNFDANDKKTQMLAVFRSADGVIGGLKRKLQGVREERETAARRVEELSAGLGRKFEGAEKITSLEIELQQLNDALSGKDRAKEEGEKAPAEGAPAPLAQRRGPGEAARPAARREALERMKGALERALPGVTVVISEEMPADMRKGLKGNERALADLEGKRIWLGLGKADTASPAHEGMHIFQALATALAKSGDEDARRVVFNLAAAVRACPAAVLRRVEKDYGKRPANPAEAWKWDMEVAALLAEAESDGTLDGMLAGERATVPPGARMWWRKVKNLATRVWQAVRRFFGRDMKMGDLGNMDPWEMFHQVNRMLATGQRLAPDTGGVATEGGILSSAERPYYKVPFAESLREVVKPGSKAEGNIYVRDTPKVFQEIGMTALPMMISPRHLRLNYYRAEAFRRYFGKLREKEHPHGLGPTLEALPKLLEHPIAIIANYAENAKPGSVVAITNIARDGGRVLVPVLIEAQARADGEQIDSHLVLTVYSDPDWVEKFVKPAIKAEEKGIGVFYVDASQLGQGMPFRGLKKGVLMSNVRHHIDDPGSPVKDIFKKQPDTRQFKRWFGKSKIVDGNGKPLVCAHRTHADFDAFDLSLSQDLEGRKAGLGWGAGKIYLVAFEHENFAAFREGQRVMRLFVKAENPISGQEYDRRLAEKIAAHPEADPESPGYDMAARDGLIAELDAEIKAEGHDGIWNKTTGELAVFEPTQVKSATDNIGTFDGRNHTILAQRGPSEADSYVPPVPEGVDAERVDEARAFDRAQVAELSAATVEEVTARMKGETGTWRIVLRHGSRKIVFEEGFASESDAKKALARQLEAAKRLADAKASLGEWREAVVEEQGGSWRIATGDTGHVLAAGYESQEAAEADLARWRAAQDMEAEALARYRKGEIARIAESRRALIQTALRADRKKGELVEKATAYIKDLGVPDEMIAKEIHAIASIASAKSLNQSLVASGNFIERVDRVLIRAAARKGAKEIVRRMKAKLPRTTAAGIKTGGLLEVAAARAAFLSELPPETIAEKVNSLKDRVSDLADELMGGSLSDGELSISGDRNRLMQAWRPSLPRQCWFWGRRRLRARLANSFVPCRGGVS
ncbi:MAG: zeta toxin family protein [Kiritimatiellae bacterium]|nr:zeta toxin family protein [Kiritimatiellia bacterium]